MRLLPLVLLAVSGCAELGFGKPPARALAAGPRAPVEAPELVVVAPPPPTAARTAEAFDTTTAEQRAAATGAGEAGGALLGTTVASLGNPAEAGLWIETPLATAPGPGRLVLPATGRSALVELRPIAGPASAGSRVSLGAMRLLGAPLTALPTLEVYAR